MRINYTVQTVFVIVWTVLFSTDVQRPLIRYRQNSEAVKALRLEMSIPILSKTDTIQNIPGHEIRYEVGDIFIHAIPITHSHSDITLNSEGEVIKDSLTGIWEKYKYLIFKKAATQGILYDSVDVTEGKKVLIDTVFTLKTLITSSKFIDIIIRNDRIVKIWKNKDSLVETYVPKIKKDISYSDSLVLRFSNRLDGFQFSMSDSLDKVKGLKLCQVKLIYNGNSKLKDTYAGKARQVTMSMKEIVIENKSEILQLIDKYKRESEENKIE